MKSNTPAALYGGRWFNIPELPRGFILRWLTSIENPANYPLAKYIIEYRKELKNETTKTS